VNESERNLREALSAAVEYIRVLSRCLDCTPHAGDRAQYRDHLAQAARLVVILSEGKKNQQLDEWIALEEHAFGWSYLQATRDKQPTKPSRRFLLPLGVNHDGRSRARELGVQQLRRLPRMP
jgi:hypothetical protein